MRRLLISEGEQQPLINRAILAGDIGVIVLLLALAALMVWRLTDLFKKNGRWREETMHRLEKKDEVQQ